MTSVNDLFVVNTTVDERPVGMILRLAPYADVAWVLQGNPPPEEEGLWMIQRLTKEVALVDGQPMSVARAKSLLSQPHLLGDFVEGRNRLYYEARLRGLIFALCPVCQQGEAEVTVARLEFGLRFSPPQLTTPDGNWLTPPKIGTVDLKRASRRGDLQTAAQLRVELPTQRMGLGALERASGCVLHKLDTAAEAAAWQTHWPPGSRMPEERAWWYRENAAFRSLVRLSAGIDRLTGGGPTTPSPSTLEVLPAIDIAYLDFAIVATQFTDEPSEAKPAPGLVPRPRSLPVDCPHCHATFLPVL